MNKLPFPRSYLGKILFVSFMGVHVPLIAAVAYALTTAGFSTEAITPVLIVVLIATLIGTGLTFAALYALLAPVREACAAIRIYLSDRTVPTLPVQYNDAAGMLLKDVQEGVTRLDTALELAETSRDEAVQERKESFEVLSGMSHDLRTPLNAIIGFSEMMQHELLGPIGQPAYKGYAKDIMTSGADLLTRVQSILDLSQIKSGEFSPETIDVDIAATAREVLALKHTQSQSRKIKLRADFDQNTLTVLSDPKAVKQAILNIVDVALSTTQENGTVAVRLIASDAVNELRIADTGKHLSLDDIPKSMAADADDSTKNTVQTPDGISSSSAIALALHVAHSMLVLSGGKIEWKNIPNGGKMFKIIFPNSNTYAAAAE